MNDFKAIVFDYDGTLCDTRAAIGHCLERALAHHHRPSPAPDRVLSAVRSGLTLPDTLLLLDASLHSDRAALHEVIKSYRTLYLSEGTPLLAPFAGVLETLCQLHQGGMKCCIVSNKGTAAIHRSLEQSRMSAFVDLIFGDEPGFPKKPDPAIVTEHVLPRYAPLQKQQILIVGDTEIDIVFARRAGVASCWAAYGYGDVARCRSLAPDHQIASIGELAALVRPR